MLPLQHWNLINPWTNQMTLKVLVKLLPVLPKYPNNQQEVKEEEEEEEIQEEEEEEVEEAEVPAPEEPKDPSYQGTLKMAIIQITSKPKMVNSKDQYMDTHFATTVEELATKDNSAQ